MARRVFFNAHRAHFGISLKFILNPVFNPIFLFSKKR